MLFKFHRPQTSTPVINLCPEQLRAVAVGTLLKLVGRSEKKKKNPPQDRVICSSVRFRSVKSYYSSKHKTRKSKSFVVFNFIVAKKGLKMVRRRVSLKLTLQLGMLEIAINTNVSVGKLSFLY